MLVSIKMYKFEYKHGITSSFLKYVGFWYYQRFLIVFWIYFCSEILQL